MKARSPALVIVDADGDGPLISLLPSFLHGGMRALANRAKQQRLRRLFRTAEKIYAVLQQIENRALPDAQKALQGVSFPQALHDDVKIERALRLFSSAWQADLIQIEDRGGKPISPDKSRTAVTGCGLSLEQAQKHFFDLAIGLIFKDNPTVLQWLLGAAASVEDLVKIRALAHFDPLALLELMQGLGRQIGQVLSELSPEQLHAFSTLRAYHFRAIRAVFGAGFQNICRWKPEILGSIASSFQCVEQIRDLGEALGLVQTPEALAALGRWDIRDITERINQERAKAGKGKLKGRRFETDIGTARVLLGNHFNGMMEKPSGVLEAFGGFIRSLSALDPVVHQERLNELRQFCDRYLEYMTGDLMAVLGLAGDAPASYGEAFYILEGLFTKQKLGRKFFEGPLRTPEGVEAVAKLRKEIDDMRGRESLKGNPEIAQFLANSDLLDRPLAPFLSVKA